MFQESVQGLPKRWFSKRVVLANVPSFRFFLRTGTSECTLVPVFVPGEHAPKPPFWPTTLLANHPFGNPREFKEMLAVSFLVLQACISFLRCFSQSGALLRSGDLSGTSVWRPQSRYIVSRIERRIKFPQNQRCRGKIALHPQIKVSHLSPDLPVALSCLTRSRQGARGEGCRGGLVEGIAALLGSENGSCYRGVSQLHSHQSRYTVQLRLRCEKGMSSEDFTS